MEASVDRDGRDERAIRCQASSRAGPYASSLLWLVLRNAEGAERSDHAEHGKCNLFNVLLKVPPFVAAPLGVTHRMPLPTAPHGGILCAQARDSPRDAPDNGGSMQR